MQPGALARSSPVGGREPSPFDDAFLPELWDQIRVFAGIVPRGYGRDNVTRAMITLTCRAEFKRRSVEEKTGADVFDQRVWITPYVWFLNAMHFGYDAICRWLFKTVKRRHLPRHLDLALRNGHIALADELEGYRLEPSSHLAKELVYDASPLKALQWLAARGYPLRDDLLSDLRSDRQLPVVRWLVEEQGCDIFRDDELLMRTLWNGCRALAAYFMDRGLTVGPCDDHDLCFHLAIGSDWDTLDLLQQRCPLLYANACERYLLIGERHATRPRCKPDEVVNLTDPDGPMVVTLSSHWQDGDLD